MIDESNRPGIAEVHSISPTRQARDANGTAKVRHPFRLRPAKFGGCPEGALGYRPDEVASAACQSESAPRAKTGKTSRRVTPE